MTKTLPITEARQNLTTLVNRANSHMDEYVITVNGKPAAVLVSADQYESLIETNEILSDSRLMEDLKKAEEDVKKGRVHDWEDVKNELGLDV